MTIAGAMRLGVGPVTRQQLDEVADGNFSEHTSSVSASGSYQFAWNAKQALLQVFAGFPGFVVPPSSHLQVDILQSGIAWNSTSPSSYQPASLAVLWAPIIFLLVVAVLVAVYKTAVYMLSPSRPCVSFAPDGEQEEDTVPPTDTEAEVSDGEDTEDGQGVWRLNSLPRTPADDHSTIASDSDKESEVAVKRGSTDSEVPMKFAATMPAALKCYEFEPIFSDHSGDEDSKEEKRERSTTEDRASRFKTPRAFGHSHTEPLGRKAKA